VEIEPSARNGLAKRSQIMVDKPQTPLRGRVGAVIGHFDNATMLAVNRALAVFLGLA
jgi:mRNA interferase MazF